MRPVIYIDVLLAVNFLVDYMLLLAVSKIVSGGAKRISIMLGAALGAVFSCTLLLPKLPAAVSGCVTVGQAAAMVLVVFGLKQRRRFFRAFILLQLMTGMYGGIMLALSFLLSPKGMIVSNGAVYLDISPLMLIGGTLLCYTGITLWSRISGRRLAESCSVFVKTDRGEMTLHGIIDTGNLLTEPFSGYPVILCGSGVQALMPGKEKQRVIPYSSVGGEGLLMGFRPIEIIISGKNYKIKTDRVYIAVGRESAWDDHEAIVSASILDNQ